jgi:hypothetical protein
MLMENNIFTNQIRTVMEEYLDEKARPEAYYSLEVNYFINRDLFKEERRELRRIAQKLKKIYPRENVELAEKQVEHKSRLLYGLKLMGPNFPEEQLKELIADTQTYGDYRAREAVRLMKFHYESCGLKEIVSWQIRSTRYLPVFVIPYGEINNRHVFWGYDGAEGPCKVGIESAEPGGDFELTLAKENYYFNLYAGAYLNYFKPQDPKTAEIVTQIETVALEYYFENYQALFQGEQSNRPKPYVVRSLGNGKIIKTVTPSELANYQDLCVESKKLWQEFREKGAFFAPEKMKRLARLEWHPFGGDSLIRLGELNQEYGIIVDNSTKIFPEFARLNRRSKKETPLKEWGQLEKKTKQYLTKEVYEYNR